MSNYVDLKVPPVMQGPYKSYEPLTWAKRNCPSYITNDAVQKGGVYYYRFYFANERDKILFTLRWS
jgi:hypothetical protein